MYLTGNIKISIYLISFLLSAFLIIFFLLKSRKSSLLLSYLFLQVLVLLWSVHSIFIQIYSQPDVFIRWNRGIGFKILYYTGYFPACLIGLGWLLFCMIYSRFREKDQKYLILSFSIPPILLYIFIILKRYIIPVNNNINSLLLLIAGVQYLYCFIGIAILEKYVVKQRGERRKQSAFILAAVLLPIIIRLPQDFNYLILRKGLLIYNFDLTSIGFSVGMLIIAIAAFRYRFLNYIPFALQKIMGTLAQAVVVTGDENEIITYNHAFMKICSSFGIEIKKEKFLDGIIEQLSRYIEKNDESIRILSAIQCAIPAYQNGEIVMNHSGKKHFFIEAQPLRRTGSEAFGKVISMNDISIHKELVQKLNEKNIELSALNVQLEQYASTVEELTLSKERNRFARDVHDTLGHTMTVLLTLLKVSSVTCETSPSETRAKIEQAIEITKEGLRELRRSISGLSPGKLEAQNFVNALNSLAVEFKASGVNVHLAIENIDHLNDTVYLSTLFRICQEALTNALRHGGAKNVTIIIKLRDGCIKLFIADDGSGCGSIKKGYGLSGMEQRVKALNGNINFGSDGEHGFSIHVAIPVVNGV